MKKPPSQEGIATVLEMMARSEALQKIDNRHLLWLAINTSVWRAYENETEADILAMIETRLHPEYDGDKVTLTNTGWMTPEGPINYI